MVQLQNQLKAGSFHGTGPMNILDATLRCLGVGGIGKDGIDALDLGHLKHMHMVGAGLEVG